MSETNAILILMRRRSFLKSLFAAVVASGLCAELGAKQPEPKPYKAYVFERVDEDWFVVGIALESQNANEPFHFVVNSEGSSIRHSAVAGSKITAGEVVFSQRDGRFYSVREVEWKEC